MCITVVNVGGRWGCRGSGLSNEGQIRIGKSGERSDWENRPIGTTEDYYYGKGNYDCNAIQCLSVSICADYDGIYGSSFKIFILSVLGNGKITYILLWFLRSAIDKTLVTVGDRTLIGWTKRQSHRELLNVISLQLCVGAGGEAEIVFDGDCTDVLVKRRIYDEIKAAITESVLKVRKRFKRLWKELFSNSWM